MTCTAQNCTCRRHNGDCIRCGREVVVSIGCRVPLFRRPALDEKGRMVDYRCVRCR